MKVIAVEVAPKAGTTNEPPLIVQKAFRPLVPLVPSPPDGPSGPGTLTSFGATQVEQHSVSALCKVDAITPTNAPNGCSVNLKAVAIANV